MGNVDYFGRLKISILRLKSGFRSACDDDMGYSSRNADIDAEENTGEHYGVDYERDD